jgi:hypothetical protein
VSELRPPILGSQDRREFVALTAAPKGLLQWNFPCNWTLLFVKRRKEGTFVSASPEKC